MSAIKCECGSIGDSVLGVWECDACLPREQMVRVRAIPIVDRELAEQLTPGGDYLRRRRWRGELVEEEWVMGEFMASKTIYVDL